MTDPFTESEWKWMVWAMREYEGQGWDLDVAGDLDSAGHIWSKLNQLRPEGAEEEG